MNLGQLLKSSNGIFSGIKADIFTPKAQPTLSGEEIKGAIFTSGMIEFGWIYRDGYSYPKAYYKYYDQDEEAATPAPEFVEVLLSDISWGNSNNFEIKWPGTNMYSEDDTDIFNLYLNSAKVADVQNYYAWNQEDFMIGLYSDGDEDSVGFLVKNIFMYKLDEKEFENAYEPLKYTSEKITWNIDINISTYDNRFYVRTTDWKY